MTNDTEWLDLETVVLTDKEAATRYGSVRFPVTELERLADELSRDTSPMVINHDPSQPIRTRNRRAWVEQYDDGAGWRLRLDIQVHRDDWSRWESMRTSVDTLGGMSLALATLLRGSETDYDIHIFGDAADFDAETLVALADAMPDPHRVSVSQLYQFAAEVEIARLAIEFIADVVRAVPTEMLSDWIAARLTRIVATAQRHERSVLDVSFHRSPDGRVEMRWQVPITPDDDTAEIVDRIATSIERQIAEEDKR